MVVGALEDISGGAVHHLLSSQEQIGPWRLFQPVATEPIALEMDCAEASPLETTVRMHIHKQAMEYVFSLVVGRYYAVRSLSAMRRDAGTPKTVTVTSDLGDVHEETRSLNDSEIDHMRKLYDLIVRVDVREARVRLILDDLMAGSRDRTKFALVHLYRAMDTIRGHFGGWRQMERALGVASDLTAIKRLRSEPKYRVAHSDVISAVARLEEPTLRDIEEARQGALSIAEKFLGTLESAYA